MASSWICNLKLRTLMNGISAKLDPVTIKLPYLVALFWLMKTIGSTLGKTWAELVNNNMHPGFQQSTIIFLSLFILIGLLQLLAKKYHSLIFWTMMIICAALGTNLADLLHYSTGLDNGLVTPMMLCLFILYLMLWRNKGKQFPSNGFSSIGQELFFWGAVLFSMFLAESYSDYLLTESGLGNTGVVLLVSWVLVLVILTYYLTKISRFVVFWAAFVLSGAFSNTISVLSARTNEENGLQHGAVTEALILSGVLAILIGVETLRAQRNQKRSKIEANLKTMRQAV
jgi:uncharacterized membrane-anchored protein